MTSDYKRYLAERVINEQEHVTYRSLSRALKVHCDLAKRMLYDFHRLENAKKPKSVNATYIVIGVPEQTEKRSPNGTHLPGDGDDEIMQSSPFTSSQVAQPEEAEDATPWTEVRLVREEELPGMLCCDTFGLLTIVRLLADAKSHFKHIFAIFMYSVQPTSPQDLNVLADLGHSVLESQPEDPLECGPRYGMIQNKNVKRRTKTGPSPATGPSPSTEAPKASRPGKVSQPVKQEEQKAKEEEPHRPAPAEGAPAKKPPSQPSSTDRASQSKRDNASIFKAFAKAKPKSEKNGASADASTTETETTSEPVDVAMGDEPDEEEREDLFLDTGTRKTSQPRESRKDREEKLKQMMEDEEMPDATEEEAPEEPPTSHQVPSQQRAEEPEGESEAPESKEAPSGTRRRRGRRQVMKKKTTRDAEGYLVTQQEPVWESFSEDEGQAPPKRKPAVSAAGKPAKAGGGKPGQGNIMSFFGKKQ